MAFHKAVGCALSALRSTLITTLEYQKNLEVLNREDIEINQIAARALIMNSGDDDWSKYIQLIYK